MWWMLFDFYTVMSCLWFMHIWLDHRQTSKIRLLVFAMFWPIDLLAAPFMGNRYPKLEANEPKRLQLPADEQMRRKEIDTIILELDKELAERNA